MLLPFQHKKHSNSSMIRKVYVCNDHIDCSHRYTIIEGRVPNDDYPSAMCYERGQHPEVSPDSTPAFILAPARGIHPKIKETIDPWITEFNFFPSKILFMLEQSDLAETHQLPTKQQIRQYKADKTKAFSKELTSLSGFRDYIKSQPKVTIINHIY